MDDANLPVTDEIPQPAPVELTPLLPPPAYPPIWVAKPQALTHMVNDLMRCPIVAVDTESNSLYAYREQVCLIQFSTGRHDYLLDSMALTDLHELAPLFASPNINKIFHAAEYDLICLRRDYGFAFENIFDTMVAARTLGRMAVGLGGVLESEFHLKIDKRYQRANWGERPLPPAQLAYARLDTHYLIPLSEHLRAELHTSGRWPLADEEFKRMLMVSLPQNAPDNGVDWRIPGSQDLTPAQAAVLYELCVYRDQRAKIANLPVFKILSNQHLIDVTLAAPLTRDDLAKVDSVPARLRDRHSTGLLQAVQRGRAAHPRYAPPGPSRPSDICLKRLDALRTWRRQTGLAMKVESDVILPRETLEQLAFNAPRRSEDLAPLMAHLPYRLELYGAEILEVIKHPEVIRENSH